MTALKFIKKPVVIEAINWTGDNDKDMLAFFKINNISSSYGLIENNELLIQTLEGLMKANIGDWIIKGVSGELYPCKPDIFNLTYEVVA